MHNSITTTLALAILATITTLVSSQYDQQREQQNYANEYANDQIHAQPSPRSYASSPKEPEKPKAAPVAILKQINRHNEDGSYTYGFEGADGSFKIETKLPSGDVKGKYGFVDDSGKVRVVEYGANQYGFQPAGEGITVAPPTLFDETTGRDGLEINNPDYDSPARQAPRQQAPAQPREQYRPQYEQPQQPQQPQSHTQAIYSPAQRTPTLSNAPQQPIFTPAAAAPPRQSQILQASQRQIYDEPAPASQAYNQGPVQFGPSSIQESRAQPQARSNPGSSGLLDQLARDYALPQNSAPPLHDISFGYY